MAKESIETLVSELVHEEDWRRMRATAACLSGGPRAVQALIHALDDRLVDIESRGGSHAGARERSSGRRAVGRFTPR